METISNREEELKGRIEDIDGESKNILEKDGVGFGMLEKIKEFFSKVPEILNITAKKK